ncbi:MAG TPA: helix-turn-helix transcriptional regulator [Herpetosiphonaceae bacterium]
MDSNNKLRNEQIAQILKSLMKKHGWTDGKLAEALHVSRYAVAHWLKPDRSIPIDQMIRICEVMNLSDRERLQLLTLKDDKTPIQLEGVQRILAGHKNGALDFIAFVHKGQLTYVCPDDFPQRMEGIAHGFAATQLHDYQEISLQMAPMISQLDDKFMYLDQGNLTRVVFDLEKGAVLFYRLMPGYIVVGITADQRRMDDRFAGAAMRAVIADLKTYLRMKP